MNTLAREIRVARNSISKRPTWFRAGEEAMPEMTFDKWRDEFAALLVQSGMPRRQVDKYYGVYEADAEYYHRNGLSPSDAATKELMLPSET